MRVLFVCNDDYPNTGACSSLLEKMFIEGGLVEQYSEIHILVPAYYGAHTTEEQINRINVHRVFSPAFMNLKELKKICFLNFFGYMYGVLTKLTERIKRRQIKGYFLNMSIEKGVYCSLKKMHAENFDVVIAVSGAYEVASAVQRFANKYCMKAILYQVDPCGSNESFSNKSIEKRIKFEKMLYEQFDKIITTPILYEEKKAIYDQNLVDKIEPMEFPNVGVDIITGINSEAGHSIHCVFSGRLYPSVRNPEYLFRLFSQMQKTDDIVLEMYGVTESELNAYIGDTPKPKNLMCHGIVDLETARKGIANADVLINIGNKLTNQVPSKVFEYISTGKPIINLCTMENCPTLSYMNRYPLCLSLVEGKGTLKEQSQRLQSFVYESRGKRLEKSWVLENYQECTAGYCANKLYEVICNVQRN